MLFALITLSLLVDDTCHIISHYADIFGFSAELLSLLMPPPLPHYALLIIFAITPLIFIFFISSLMRTAYAFERHYWLFHYFHITIDAFRHAIAIRHFTPLFHAIFAHYFFHAADDIHFTPFSFSFTPDFRIISLFSLSLWYYFHYFRLMLLPLLSLFSLLTLPHFRYFADYAIHFIIAISIFALLIIAAISISLFDYEFHFHYAMPFHCLHYAWFSLFRLLSMPPFHFATADIIFFFMPFHIIFIAFDYINFDIFSFAIFSLLLLSLFSFRFHFFRLRYYYIIFAINIFTPLLFRLIYHYMPPLLPLLRRLPLSSPMSALMPFHYFLFFMPHYYCRWLFITPISFSFSIITIYFLHFIFATPRYCDALYCFCAQRAMAFILIRHLIGIIDILLIYDFDYIATLYFFLDWRIRFISPLPDSADILIIDILMPEILHFAAVAFATMFRYAEIARQHFSDAITIFTPITPFLSLPLAFFLQPLLRLFSFFIYFIHYCQIDVSSYAIIIDAISHYFRHADFIAFRYAVIFHSLIHWY